MPPAHGGNYQPGQTGSQNVSQASADSNPSFAHGGAYQPGQSRTIAQQNQYYEQSSSLTAHGGDYRPGQATAQSNSPPVHGENYQLGQLRRKNVPQASAQQISPVHDGDYELGEGRRPNVSQAMHYEPAHEHMIAALPAAYPKQHQHFIPDPVQAPFSHNPANQHQSYQNPQYIRREPFMITALELGRANGIADTVTVTENHHRRKFQKGYANISEPKSRLKWKFPNSYQLPGLSFVSKIIARHRDSMQREHEGPEEDRYISPWDGHLAKLVVQATQDIYDGAQNSTWRRTFVREVSPIYLQLANFPFNTVPADPGVWTGEDWAMVGLKWIPACFGLLCCLMWHPNAAEGQVRNNGWYDPFLYRYWGYPKAARNFYESPSAVDLLPHGGLSNSLLIQRVLGPRYLCFLNEPSESKLCGVTISKVDKSTADTPYIFIAYTTEQFGQEDLEDLHNISEKAARDAGVPAYWVGCSCMQDRDQVEDDVYRISDVIRGAKSLVIAIGPSQKRPDLKSSDEMLKIWGERMWTLPEALLSPAEKDIKVYTRGSSQSPRVISKKQFAAVVWDDPLISRQLVDHYNKTLDLSSLELVSIALNCLGSRKTIEYLPGDLSYALMGLLRQRPQIDKTDSDFQAFTRLSLANDSNMLLERLICMLPKDHNASWLAMDDAWNASLWDIYPRCQVAGLGHNDTVILDGAYGATIRWKAFATVASLGHDSWRRIGSRSVVHGAPVLFLAGIVIIANSRATGNTFTYLGIGAFLLVISLIIVLVSPYLVRVIYSGKLWGTQAWFFGFEGYLDLPTIESHIFGAYMGRLKWSPSGSSISKHVMNQYGECVGVDPTLDPRVKEMVEQGRNCRYGEMRVFTLVDTYTLTVTMFLAVRPPVAVLLCGHEGGMQRAVMCSYDWSSQTLYRETVLRMETPVLERMFRVHRFRFGLQRPLSRVQ